MGSSTNMKFFVISSILVAAAYAEADADPYYAAYGYAGHPVAYAGIKSAPCVNSANLPVPCAGGVANGYAYGAFGYPYASAYAGYPYGIYGRKKREAEAEPEADAYYAAYGAYPYAAADLGYAGLGYTAGLGYSGLGYAAGIPNPVHAVAATPAGLTHSSNVGICTNYLGASVPCGRKKREAEAEPEADASYGAYPYAAGLGYAAYGAYPYAGVAATGLGYAAYGAYPYAGVAATNAAVGHAVAYTPLGAVHSSHVGVCTNNLGAQVPC